MNRSEQNGARRSTAQRWLCCIVVIGLIPGCGRQPQVQVQYTQLKRDLLELRQAAVLSRHSDIGLAAPTEFFAAIRRLENDYRLQVPKPGTNSCLKIQFAINNADALGLVARPSSQLRTIENCYTILTYSTEEAIQALEREELPQP